MLIIHREEEIRGRERHDALIFQEEQTACCPPFPQRTSLPTAAPSWECTHTQTHTHTCVRTHTQSSLAVWLGEGYVEIQGDGEG